MPTIFLKIQKQQKQRLAWRVSNNLYVTYVVMSVGTKTSNNVTKCPHSLARCREETRFMDMVWQESNPCTCAGNGGCVQGMQSTPVQWDYQKILNAKTSTTLRPRPGNEASGWVPIAHTRFKITRRTSECHLESRCRASAKFLIDCAVLERWFCMVTKSTSQAFIFCRQQTIWEPQKFVQPLNSPSVRKESWTGNENVRSPIKSAHFWFPEECPREPQTIKSMLTR